MLESQISLSWSFQTCATLPPENSKTSKINMIDMTIIFKNPFTYEGMMYLVQKIQKETLLGALFQRHICIPQLYHQNQSCEECQLNFFEIKASH